MSIVVENLSKRFNMHVAVDQLSFEVHESEVLGFLGPNGAGKSTTMKMLTGFLEPTSGDINICGFDIAKQPIQAKKIIGYLPEGAPAYGEMTVKEFLKFIAAIRRLSKAQTQIGLEYVIEKLRLDTVINQPVETLSKGFKRRVGLAQALIHDPKVLIMDEPTDGLDPNQKHQVRELITSLTKDKIVIISTHILEEVTAVCTRALIIADGALLVDDTPSGLLARSRFHNAVSVRVNDASLVEKLNNLAEVRSVSEEANGRWIIFPKTTEALYPIISRTIRQNQWDIEDVQVEIGRMDEVFRTVTSGSMT